MPSDTPRPAIVFSALQNVIPRAGESLCLLERCEVQIHALRPKTAHRPQYDPTQHQAAPVRRPCCLLDVRGLKVPTRPTTHHGPFVAFLGKRN